MNFTCLTELRGKDEFSDIGRSKTFVVRLIKLFTCLFLDLIYVSRDDRIDGQWVKFSFGLLYF